MKLFDILKDKEKMKHLITYGIFGVLTTIVSFGSFYILRKTFINVDENILNTISIIIAVIFAYFVNKKFVFKSKDKNIFKEFGKFAASRAFSALFEMVAFFILNTLLNIDGMISKVLISIIVIVLNYITSKVFVFKDKIKQEKM